MLIQGQPEADTEAERVYFLCFSDQGRAVPGDEFLEAASDAEAADRATFIKPWTTREIWDHHRLVCVVPPFASASQACGLVEA